MKSPLIPLAIIIFGVLLRLYNPFFTPFAFDQVQILEAAEAILQGSPTLIGPRTGPATMFTGPLIYYVTAFFGIFMPLYWAAVITPAFFSLATGLIVWLLARRYLSSHSQVLIVTLWAVSPFLISLDRVFWNPNLMLMAAALAYFPLFKLKSLNLVDGGLLALGVFLGYQAHFSGFLLWPFIVMSLILRAVSKKEKPLTSLLIFCLAGLGLVVSILPTALFDLRHDYLNLRGILGLVQNSDQVSLFQSLARFPDKLFIVFETGGKLLFYGGSGALLFVTGLGTLVGWLSLVRQKLADSAILIPIAWLASIVIIFSLYRESTPEYYFLILVPVFLNLLTDLLSKILTGPQLKGLLVFLVIYGSLFSLWHHQVSRGLDLATQLETTRVVKERLGESEVAALQWDIEPIEALGLRYLMSYQGVELPDHDQVRDGHDRAVLALKFPIGDSVLLDEKINDRVGVWLDPRADSTLSYLTRDEYLLSAPGTISFFESSVPNHDFASSQFLLVSSAGAESKIVGELTVVDLQNDPEKATLAWELIELGQYEVLFENPTHLFFGKGKDIRMVSLVRP